MKRVLSKLYVQVLLAVVLGITVGAVWPAAGEALAPLGDGFIKLIKMLLAPVNFLTVVSVRSPAFCWASSPTPWWMRLPKATCCRS